jgi:ubiquinone/menaquinone biosynthesis C-methylase UbiE
MKPQYEAIYRDFEENYFWFVARRQLIRTLLQNSFNKKIKLLDVGCGSGTMIKYLSNDANLTVIGIDNSKIFVSEGRKKGLNIKFGNAAELPFKKSYFDVVICADVLEHLKNDASALIEIYRVLKKGGIAFVSVPALQFLWDSHDVENQHFRRYSKQKFKNLCIRAGFNVKKLSFWGASMVPLKIMAKIIPGKQSHLVQIPKLINSAFLQLLRFENFVVTNSTLPIGTSLVAVLEKQ